MSNFIAGNEHASTTPHVTYESNNYINVGSYAENLLNLYMTPCSLQDYFISIFYTRHRHVQCCLLNLTECNGNVLFSSTACYQSCLHCGVVFRSQLLQASLITQLHW